MCDVNKKELTLLKNTDLFDADWYIKKYEDVRLSNLDPYVHFLKYGYKMLRDPSENFSSLFYVETNPTVKKKNLNPLLHFITRKVAFKPNENYIVWAMYQLSTKDRDRQAIELGEKYLKDKAALYPFLANFHLKNGDAYKWFFYLNLYLESFKLLPISEVGNDVNILNRIKTDSFVSTKSDILVTILMPAWNAESSIKMAAESILNQTWDNIELIIIDDASEDSTWDIISEIAKKDKRVKLLRNSENLGPYVSKNRGARIAKGDYITGHDSDDWAHPQRIEIQTRYLIDNDELACLSGMLRINQNGLLVNFNKIGTNTKDGITRSAFISLMINNHFFRNVLGYWDNVRFGADSELIKRIEVIQGKPISHIYKPTMLCLDNPNGLTNHPVFGHSQNVGISQIRLDYKNSFLAWHKKIKKTSGYLDFYQSEREFSAPDEAINSFDKMEGIYLEDLKGSRNVKINCDVCIITNLCFPGGNCSSTLDEIRYLTEQGYNVKVVHSPRDSNLNKPLSNRFFPFLDRIFLWKDIENIYAKSVIIRHPGTIASSAFKKINRKISTENAYFVINNSMYRTTGELVYEPASLSEVIKSFHAKEKFICPISFLMRNEVKNLSVISSGEAKLSLNDWNPTFNLSEYDLPPKKVMKTPFSIGRHGRDGQEKWIENINELSKAYPVNHPDFNIKILGGARHAIDLIGECPDNWDIKPFGLISPKEYLQELDVFVYFPNTNLSEAFGRTIVEAMFASIPCVLPVRFKEVFGDLAFYSSPENVCDVIYRLSQDDEQRIQYLTEVKNIALSKFSSSIIPKRLNINSSDDYESNLTISECLLRYKNWIEGEG